VLTVAYLPALVAMAVAGRGAARLFWSVSAVLAIGCLVLMVSRGAFLATVVAAAAGIYFFRRQISTAVLLRFGLIAAAVITGVVMLVLSTQYGEFINDRLEGTVGGGTLTVVSAGRTDLWLAAIDRMARVPITFLTGYGWRAYFVFPHVLSTHNWYLDAWFNLGLPGLVCWILLFWTGVKTAWRAAGHADAFLRPHLMAATIGIIGTAVGLFFVEWFEPWKYFWIYFGLAMRMAVLSGIAEGSPHGTSGNQSSVSALGTSGASRDSFGWSVGNK
jgi:O-antigen ligase